jgi:hypothetical protein
LERVSVNLHACSREQLRDTADCHIEGDAQHCRLSAKPRVHDKRLDVVHEHERSGLLDFARLEHSEQAVPHGLPLNFENRADSVGEVPWLRIEHLLNQIVREELLALPGVCEAFASSSLSS